MRNVRFVLLLTSSSIVTLSSATASVTPLSRVSFVRVDLTASAGPEVDEVSYVLDNTLIAELVWSRSQLEHVLVDRNTSPSAGAAVASIDSGGFDVVEVVDGSLKQVISDARAESSAEHLDGVGLSDAQLEHGFAYDFDVVDEPVYYGLTVDFNAAADPSAFVELVEVLTSERFFRVSSAANDSGRFEQYGQLPPSWYRIHSSLQVHTSVDAGIAGPVTEEADYRLSLRFTQCPADVTSPSPSASPDDAVDVLDLLNILASWGTSGPGSNIALPHDVVDVFDLLGLLSAWGSCD